MNVHVFCAVTLANYLNRRRHTNQAWVLVGFFPILNPNHGVYKGPDKIARRKVRLWHACTKILTESIKEAYIEGTPVKCADGNIRIVKPIVANWLGDRDEHEVVCGIVSVRFQTNSNVSKFLN